MLDYAFPAVVTKVACGLVLWYSLQPRVNSTRAQATSPAKGTPKIVFLDMDGTLLNSSHKISSANQSCLRRLSKAGVRIVLATGRPITRVLSFASSMPPTFDVVSLNGAIIAHISPNGSQQIESSPRFDVVRYSALPFTSVKELLGIAMQLEIRWAVHEAATCHLGYAPTSTDRDGSPFSNAITITEDPFQTLATPADRLLLKVTVKVGEGPAIRQRFVQLVNASEVLNKAGSVNMAHTRTTIEFTRPGCGKSTGVKVLCDKYGIAVTDAVSFGDSGNDVCMLRVTGRSYAPNNCSERARANVKTVSSLDNNQDFVATELESLFSC